MRVIIAVPPLPRPLHISRSWNSSVSRLYSLPGVDFKGIESQSTFIPRVCLLCGQSVQRDLLGSFEIKFYRTIRIKSSIVVVITTKLRYKMIKVIS
jgi:hypothetical protein